MVQKKRSDRTKGPHARCGATSPVLDAKPAEDKNAPKATPIDMEDRDTSCTMVTTKRCVEVRTQQKLGEVGWSGKWPSCAGSMLVFLQTGHDTSTGVGWSLFMRSHSTCNFSAISRIGRELAIGVNQYLNLVFVVPPFFFYRPRYRVEP